MGMLLDSQYVDKRKEMIQYQGSMTDSIQLDYYRQIANKTSIKEKNGHYYCDDFISVTFEKSVNLKDDDIKMTKKEVRDYLYLNGFIHNGKQYIRYQRSDGGARLGNCLFINEKYHKKMIKFSNMGINFKEGERCDLASLFAYQSKTLSTKIDDIIILPNEILLIDDQCSNFKAMASVTRLNEKGKIYLSEEELEHVQDIWDGQSLVDESVFRFHGYDKKGMLLLRNHFFKSACFNTNIQKYYSDNGITTVVDMFGRELEASKIKLITTPNSVKALKFSYKMNVKKNADEKMYDYWLSKIVDFGLVKYEKPSKFGSYNRTAYQMVNSLPFSRDDIKKLMKEEINYINLINTKPSAFKHRLSVSEPNTNYSFVLNMITINDDIQYTKLYKDARRKVLDSHKKKLLRGQIRIQNTDYFTMVSMPYEMLEYSTYGKWNPVLHGRQVYTPYYKNDKMLTGFRNPHINSGNVAVFKNTYDVRFDEYFNLTNNIVIVSCWDNDVTSRLQGADFDSDTVLLTSNEIVLEKATNVQHHYTPVNGVNASKIQRYYTLQESSDVDYTISTNKIGEIVNLSQLFNSHYWATRSDEKRQMYYNCSSILSSMSQIEIDKAKKLFDFSMISAINYVKKISGINVKIKPNFFKYVVENPSKCEFMEFETPMDYVVDEVSKIKSAIRSKNLKLNKFIKYGTTNSSYSQIENISKMMIEYQTILDSCTDRKGKYIARKIIGEELSLFFNSKNITRDTLISLIIKTEKEFSSIKNIMLNALYENYSDEFVKILKINTRNSRILSEDVDGDIVIFSKKFKEIAKK